MTQPNSPPQTSILPTNPLGEADPFSLDLLFNKAPPWTDADLEVMVKELRRQAVAWKTAEAAGAKRAPAKKAATAPKGPKIKAGPELTLEDLIEDDKL